MSFRAAAAQQLCSTNPHEPPRAALFPLVQSPATRGFVVGVVVGIPRWHARGQGFKSPQLHQAQRIGSTPAQGHLPEICQSLTVGVQQTTLSADRFGWFRSGLRPNRSVARLPTGPASDARRRNPVANWAARPSWQIDRGRHDLMRPTPPFHISCPEILTPAEHCAGSAGGSDPRRGRAQDGHGPAMSQRIAQRAFRRSACLAERDAGHPAVMRHASAALRHRRLRWEQGRVCASECRGGAVGRPRSTGRRRVQGRRQ
jgi:hypothetical protein